MSYRNKDLRGVITIDGPSGAGKSTVAKKLAQQLGLRYLDTGALYRALALWLDQNGVAPQEGPELSSALQDLDMRLDGDKVFVFGKDWTSKIRTAEAGLKASEYSALPSVRSALLDLQRAQALAGPLVADGRDMGTVVFPLAPVKVYLTASAQTRAKRRQAELEDRGEFVPLQTLQKQMEDRDLADSQRKISPLKRPEGSFLIDSSQLDIDQVVQQIIDYIGG